MAAVHRVTTSALTGDLNTGNGVAKTPIQTKTYANNQYISVDGVGVSSHSGSCPGPSLHCEGNSFTANGCTTVYGGISDSNATHYPINKAGDLDNCSHVREPTASPNVFVCGLSGGGTVIDESDPYLGQPSAGLSPNVPTAGQPVFATAITNITRSDVEIYRNNQDDPDGTLGSVSNVFIKSNLSTIAQDLTSLGSPIVTPVQECSLFNSLPAAFTWNSGSPLPPDFPTWARNPGTWPHAQLSPNFTVADVTVDTSVSYYAFSSSSTQSSGFTQKQILQNLCYHSKTILEPLLADGNVPTFTITSGFRQSANGSQHNIGQATDLQFESYHGVSNTGTLYYNLAKYIRDNFYFDQLILEWYGRQPWIHISTNSSGHRGSILTQISPSSYSSGLIHLG